VMSSTLNQALFWCTAPSRHHRLLWFQFQCVLQFVGRLYANKFIMPIKFCWIKLLQAVLKACT
jgi:hypothetical protein